MDDLKKIKIAIADDHQLFLKSLVWMLEQSLNNYQIVIQALNGQELLDKIRENQSSPDILLLDVNMPIMNGIETAKIVSEKYPAIKIVALTMNDDKETIISMIKAGCCAYLLKDTHPLEFEKILKIIYNEGYYHRNVQQINFEKVIHGNLEEKHKELTEKEIDFLKLTCTEYTYKAIASELNMSERTADAYREKMFKYFNVQSRVGLCIELIKRKIVEI